MNTSKEGPSTRHHTSDINIAAALVTYGVATAEPCGLIVATPEGEQRVEFFFQPNAKDGTSTQSLIEAWDGRGRPIPTDDVFAWLKAFAANKRKLVQFIKTGRPLILVERNGRRALVEYGSPLHRKLAPSQVSELKPLEANGRLD